MKRELDVMTDAISQINIINDISWELYISNHFDSSMHYSLLALQKSKAIQYTEGEVNASINIGRNYLKFGDHPSALEYFTKTIALAKSIKDLTTQASALGNIATMYKRQKQFDDALKTYHESLALFQQLNDTPNTAGAYLNIGAIYQEQEQYDQALAYIYKGTELFRKADDHFGLRYAYTNLAGVYIDLEHYDTAIRYLDSVIWISEKAQVPHADPTILSGKGYIFLKMNQPAEARKLLTESVDIARQIKDSRELKDAYMLLSKADSMLGDYKSAYFNYIAYDRLNDSIFNESSIRKVTELEMKYEFSKTRDSIRVENEKEIAIRDATLTVHKREKWILGFGLIGLGILGGILYRQSILRKRNNMKLLRLNEELDKANKTKNRFFSILNHDLRSPVSSLIHFLQLKKDEDALLDAAHKALLEEKTIRNAEQLLSDMEDLLMWSKGQMTNFRPQPVPLNIRKIFADNAAFFSGNEDIDFQYHAPEDLCIRSDENYIKTIIRNLTSNSIKALQHTSHPQISWEAYSGLGQVILKITDNGPGAASDQFKALYDESEVAGIKSGLGLHLIRDLAQAVHCSIKVDSNDAQGVAISIIIPQ